MSYKPEKIIMYDSQEAAKLVTVTGWENSIGFFHANAENEARWIGCTHIQCKGCGRQTIKIYNYCKECREMRESFRYRSFKKIAWNGVTPVCTFAEDHYFLGGISDVETFCEDNNFKIEDLQLVHCEPIPIPEVDIFEYLSECMTEDMEKSDIPDEILNATEVLNRLIRNAETMAWRSTVKAVLL